ncbi:MAG: helix-turn-helix transcriptional regulator, partial [Acidobacteria bacterium]|nr:helix-turn-helix transcriptional regulator [Acidobacteriota bacterium]
MTTSDFAEAVRRRLAERGQSQYRAAVNSGLPQDAIRSVLNGHVPRLNRVEQICRALGLELYIGPPRDVQVEADG